MPQGDISKYTDEELMKIAGVGGGAKSDLSAMSDEELMAIAGSGGESSSAPLGDTGLKTNPNVGVSEPEFDSPLDPGQRAQLSFPSSFEAKKQLASQAFGFSPEDIGELPNGKLSIKGIPVDPTPKGFLSFLRDLPGDLADLAGPSLPVLGQAGADIAAVASGVGTLGLLGANAAGAASGEAFRQTIASGLTGEQFNPGKVAGEGAVGALGAGGALAINAGFKSAAREMARFTGFMSKKIPDKLPEILEAVGQIDREATRGYVDLLKRGANPVDIISDKTANPAYAMQFTKRTLLGHPGAEETSESIAKQFQNLISRQTDEAGKQTIRAAYKEFFPNLTDDTFDLLQSKVPLKEILDPANASDDALASLGKATIESVDAGFKNLQMRYGKALTRFSVKNGNKNIDVDQPLTNLLKSISQETPQGLPILVEGKINQNYTGKEAKEIYSTVMRRFMSLEKKALPKDIAPKDFAKFFSESGELLPEHKAGELVLKNKQIPATSLNKIIDELQPMLNKAFKRLSPEESKPLAEFMKNLRGQIGGLSPELAALNKRYQLFYDLKDGLFGKLNANKLEDRITAIRSLRAIAQSPDPAIKKSLMDGAKKLDFFLPRKISPRLRRVIAAEELKNVEVSKGLQKFINNSSKLLPKDSNEAASIFMSRFNQAIKQPTFKFVDDAKKHLIAQEFTKRPQNIFRIRALYYILGGGALGGVLGSTLGGAATGAGIGASLALTRPQTLGKIAGRLVQASGKSAPQIPAMSQGAGRAAGSASRQLLSQLLRMRQG